MKKTLEQLADEIYKEMLADGEEVTKEEALEMASMEMGAKQIKRYEQSTVEKKQRKPRERKIDEQKKFLLECILAGLRSTAETDDFQVKTETEINFTAYGNQYTVKLTKHRLKK